jgi:hypothetical protein
MKTKYSRLRKRKKEHDQTVGYRKVRRQQQRINQGRLSRMAARKVARAQSGSRQQRRIHSSASPTIRRFARRTQSVGGETTSIERDPFYASLLSDRDVMEYVFRHSKRRWRYAQFATVQGKPVPIPVVKIEGWRRESSPVKGLDMYKGRWSEERIAAYLTMIKDRQHPYWAKFVLVG